VIILLRSALFCVAQNRPAVAEPSRFDEACLKYLVEETRLNFLANQYYNLDLHLPPDDRNAFLINVAVHDAARGIPLGFTPRDKFIADAPNLLDKRRKEIERVFGDKLKKAQGFVDEPQNQAQIFAQVLGDVIRPLNLPFDKEPWATLLNRVQEMSREDFRVRNKGAAKHDQAWLDAYDTETAKGVLAALKPEQQKEVIRVWPTAFPSGPKPPSVGQ
jgi:hypothetical protein